LILITGVAGFIGSHLADFLTRDGKQKVLGIDNLMLGKIENIEHLIRSKRLEFVKMDANNPTLRNILKNKKIEIIYHLAANSDIQAGSLDLSRDFKNTFLSTYTIAKLAEEYKIKRLFFASTSAIYGDVRSQKLDENYGPLQPISFYGAAKLSSEAYLSAFSYMFDISVCILRFPNVVGAKATHGVIIDFIKKLRKTPEELEILGDGSQRKPYLHVEDLLKAINLVMTSCKKRYEVYNVAGIGRTTVKEIADIVCQEMNLTNVRYRFTGGNIGWKGDVPEFSYDTSKIESLGWKPRYDSTTAVRKAVKQLLGKEK